MNERSVDLNRIQLFLDIVRAGNISKTANLTGLRKSKISRDLALLEQELGAQLIYRTTRQFSLSAEGQAFYDRASRSLELLNEAISEVSSGAKKIAGHISITSPEDLGQFVVLPALEEFSRLYPEVTYNINFSTEVVDLVANKVDLAVRVGKLKDSSLKMMKIGQIEFGLYCSTSLYEKLPIPLQLEDLSRQPTIHFQGSGLKPVWNLQCGDKEESVRLSPVASLNSYTAVIELVRSGLGISLLPHFAVRNDLLKGGLVHILKEWTISPTDIQIVYPQQNEEQARVKALGRFLVKKMKMTF